MKKRVLAIILTFCMTFIMSPATAFAADGQNDSTEQPVNTVSTGSEAEGGTTGANTETPAAGTETAAEFVAEVNGNKYETLAAAVSAVQDGGTIIMLDNAEGSGIGTFRAPGETKTGVKNFTIDFQNHTYTCTGPAVGSMGTQSQAFHLEWNGNGNDNVEVTLKNGKIDSTANSGVFMLIQNYCDLTLDNMILDGSNIGKGQYTLSNNCGNVLIKDTEIIAPENGFAFDSCDYASYTGVSVKVEGNSYINGKIELSNPNGGDNNANITLSGGYFTSDIKDYLKEGYAVLPSNKAGYTYMVGKAAAEGVEPAVGAPAVDMEQIPAENQADVQTVAESVAADEGVLAAAANLAAESVSDKQKTDAENALKQCEEVETDGLDIYVYSQIYLAITPSAYDAEGQTVTLNIVPMSRVVASTADTAATIKVVGEVSESEQANAVVLAGSQTEVDTIINIAVSVELPNGFSPDADTTYYAKHIHDGKVYYYPLNIKEDGGKYVATFTNLHGFSEFQLPVSLEPAASITVNGKTTVYETLQNAVDAVKDGQTITALKNDTADVSRKVHFTVVKDPADITCTINIKGSYRNQSDNEGEYDIVPRGGGSVGSGNVNTDVDDDIKKPCDGGKDCPSRHLLDVKTDAWYHESVDYVVSRGLMNGAAATAFEPLSGTTRGMIVTILYRMEGEPAAGEIPFADVAAGQYYSKAVAWAAANNIVNGHTDGNFAPNDDVLREQLAAILYRYAVYKGYDASARADLLGYADFEQISPYAVGAMAWANAEGLITGREGNLLAPDANAARAEAASILMRFCERTAK